MLRTITTMKRTFKIDGLPFRAMSKFRLTVFASHQHNNMYPKKNVKNKLQFAILI